LINFVCQTCGCKHVVDVGAGQGHLSRLLTFGHGLKVTTVEASGCHAPKAEKFDK
jgi:2-polyprenyl-3-methyl-5-hydroxy-6-metoxy-1,4-benzoquinol methylase